MKSSTHITGNAWNAKPSLSCTAVCRGVGGLFLPAEEATYLQFIRSEEVCVEMSALGLPLCACSHCYKEFFV